MLTNFKILVLGADPIGYSLAKQLILAKPGVTVGIMVPNKQQYLSGLPKKMQVDTHITLVEATPIWMQYVKGLIHLTTTTSKYFAEQLIIATGERPQLGDVLTSIKNRVIPADQLDELTITAQTALMVLGSTPEAAKVVLKLAKTAARVFLVTEQPVFKFTPNMLAKIARAGNISLLPNCYPSSAHQNQSTGTNEVEVELNTYAKLKCDAIIYCEPPMVPNVPAISTSILKLADTGAIETGEDFTVNQIPNVFAIGGCATNTSTELTTLVNTVIRRV